MNTGITQTNNEIKDILKIIRSLQKSGIIWAGERTIAASQGQGKIKADEGKITPGQDS